MPPSVKFLDFCFSAILLFPDLIFCKIFRLPEVAIKTRASPCEINDCIDRTEWNSRIWNGLRLQLPINSYLQPSTRVAELLSNFLYQCELSTTRTGNSETVVWKVRGRVKVRRWGKQQGKQFNRVSDHPPSKHSPFSGLANMFASEKQKRKG